MSHHSESLPVKCYESIIDIVNGDTVMLFVELKYSLATEVSIIYVGSKAALIYDIQYAICDIRYMIYDIRTAQQEIFASIVLQFHL